MRVLKMKRNAKKVLVMLVAAVFLACNGGKAAQSLGGGADFQDDNETDAVFAGAFAVKAAFDLDYTPELPETDTQAETVSLSGSRNGSGGGNQVIGGGLRPLDKYATRYLDADKEKARIAALQAAVAENAAGDAPRAGDFSIVNWGPKGEQSVSMKHPALYVVFSRPVVPLSALGEVESKSAVLAVDPPLKGVYRWYGTSLLSFEADVPLEPSRVYTLTVGDKTKSVYGEALKGERVFSFTTEELSLTNIVPGYNYKKNNPREYFTTEDVPPGAAREAALYFNHAVKADVVKDYIKVIVNNKETAFQLSNISESVILCTIKGEVDYKSAVDIMLLKGAYAGSVKMKESAVRGTEDLQTKTYKTLNDFRITGFGRAGAYGRYRNIVDIDFRYPLDPSSVEISASIKDPPFTLTKDNIEVFYKTIRLYNLPVSYESKFTITARGTARDRYGRTLDIAREEDITMPKRPPPSGFANFVSNRSNVFLEAQFPPRYVFEYMNVADGSSYRVLKKDNPFSKSASILESVRVESPEVDYKYFADIDLARFLTGGRGTLQFEATLNLMDGRGSWRKWDEKTVIQITDLGITARSAFNKTVVLVTKLSTGEPVAGARVRLLAAGVVQSADNIADAPFMAEALTNNEGLAVLPLEPGVFRENAATGYGMDTPFVYAAKDADAAVFQPSSHDPWSFDVNYRNASAAEREMPVAFMFTDRGLYKPGEVLTFRGIDKSLAVGKYSSYTGGYSVTLEEDRYNGSVIETLTGDASASGGFWGKVAIPPSAVPGSYRLVYKRNGARNNLANIPVTVAYFERLKFEAKIAPPASAVIAGDSVNATLVASYLSGGSLSDASYEANWYSSMGYFHPATAETRGFVFGPRRIGDSERYIGSDRGVLSGMGEARLSHTTGGESVVGAPYTYRVSAAVTDLSNQEVAAQMAITVHPALFYLGAARENGKGFLRAGEEAVFSLLPVRSDDGSAGADAVSSLLGAKKTASVTLVREEWRRTAQNGVSGYIYYDYIKEEIEDGKAESVSLTAKNGITFKVKPSKAGFYILRVRAEDRDGRTALTEYTFYATGRGAGLWNSGGAEEIRLTPDQDEYNPGDSAEVFLQSPLPRGHYLITLEREGVYTEEVRYFDGESALLKIPIARNFVPVVYLAVSSYSVRGGEPTHQYGERDLDKPKGYFGVTPLFVNPKVRSFSVEVDAGKASFRPGEEVTLSLTAKKAGKPVSGAELTLMAVDRGVLDLIDYHVDDPISHFYRRSLFPLYVSGGDSRADLMDPVTYSVKNLQGGDSNDSKIGERENFNPTAVFEPCLVTDSAGKVTVKFKLPDTLTTYRITVFGVKDDIFALKESEIASQNLANVREVLPRRLRERDTAEAGVLITNLDSKAHNLKVALKTAPPRQAGADDEGGAIKSAGLAIVDGTTERSVNVGAGGNAVLYFDIAAIKAGYISLEWTVSSDILNERLVNEMQIEHPFVYETFTTTGSAAQGKEARESLVIPSYADGGVGSLKLTLDATRLAELDAAINYLFHYPYGCMEQRSAAVFPLVIFGEYIDVLSLKNEVANPKKAVEKELASWAKAQLSDGGFPYWPSGTRADAYVSLRIAHILAVAKEKKIAVPAGININKLLDYLEMESRRSANQYYGLYNSAWTSYIFALHGRGFDTAQIAAVLNNKDASVSALAVAGLTALKLGRQADAKTAGDKIRARLQPSTRGVYIANTSAAPSYYDNETERLALALELLVQLEPGSDTVTRLLFSLLQTKRAAGYWSSTASTVRVLSAIDTLIKTEKLDKTNITGRASINGAGVLTSAFRGLGAKPASFSAAFDDAPLSALEKDKTFPLVFSADGTGNIFYTAQLSYAVPQEIQVARDEGFSLYMTVFDAKTGEEVKNNTLKQGVSYRARVKVSTPRSRAYVALRLPLPSGAEILDSAFKTTADSGYGASSETDYHGRSSYISYSANYDNEAQYFYDYFGAGEAEVELLFRAARRGVYPTPPLQVECMYESEVFGRTAGVLWRVE